MLDREIAGITCLTVLAGLESYLAGELDDTDRARIETHLGACDRCARFGGVYAGTCRDLHELLGQPETVPDSIRDRLRRRLDADLSNSAD